jgi:LEA14-like dessication related protein
VEYEDRIPLPRLPKVSIGSIGLNSIGNSGAKLELLISLQVENPNSFALLLDQLAYDLELDGRRVGGTRLNQQWQIEENGMGTLRLPISLDFLQLGNSLYSALLNGGKLDYHLIGAMAGGSPNPAFGRFNLPLEESGTTRLGN